MRRRGRLLQNMQRPDGRGSTIGPCAGRSARCAPGRGRCHDGDESQQCCSAGGSHRWASLGARLRPPCAEGLKCGQRHAKLRLNEPRSLPTARAARGRPRRRPAGPRARASSARCSRSCCSNANRVVPTERLIDELWGDDAARDRPLRAAGLRRRPAQGARRRRRLAPDERARLRARRPGRAQLDLDASPALRAEASAAARGARALAWRLPLADLDGEPFAAAAAGRLEELRLARARGADRRRPRARPSRRARRRARGARRRAPVPRAVPGAADARALPLRPAGRRARGLPGGARSASSTSSGSSPAPELQALERSMLDQDPRSGARRLVASGDGSAAPTDARVVCSPLVGAARSSAAAAVAAARPAARRGDAAHGAEPNSVAIIDPATNEVVGAVPVGTRPGPDRRRRRRRSGSAISTARR